MNIDAASMAQMLVSAERTNMDSLLQKQATRIKDETKGLDTLKSQLSTFKSLLTDLDKISTLQAQKTTLSQDGYLNVTSNGSAISGQYSFFVSQLAQAHQLGWSFASETQALPSDGTLDLTVAGQTMTVDFATLGAGATVTDLVSTINNAGDNPGVKASLVRSGGQVTLLLSSEQTGVDNAISTAFTAGTPSAETTVFDTAVAGQSEITAAQDAIVQMGGTNPLTITSASNKLDNVIDGLTIDLTRAQAVGDSPLTVTVAQDDAAITEALDKFVSGYNTLVDQLAKLTQSSSDGSGPLANDSMVRSLASQLRTTIRALPGGLTLGSLGIETDKYGKLSLDKTAFTDALEQDPTILGTALMGGSGLIESLESVMEPFTKLGGSISLRKDSLQLSQRRLDDRMDAHERRMESSYNRYLAQFSRLNTLMSQMDQTSSMFG